MSSRRRAGLSGRNAALLSVLVQAEGLEAAAAQAIGFIKAMRAEAADGQAPTICVIASSEKTREAMAKQLLPPSWLA